jgi:hypothetical protein
MNKSTIIIILLLLIIAFGSYKFIYQGSTSLDKIDGRTIILLTIQERNLILEEMRGFLNSTQKIIQAISENNMPSAVIAAKAVGRDAQQKVPATLVGKLPIAFKKLGFDTHAKFDELAMDAEDMEDKEQTLILLAKLMNNCLACHDAYKLSINSSVP